MKVNAEYFPLKNGEYYRRKTLLQFGNSTHLIGSAVLINPGSASPSGSADIGFVNSFYQNNHDEEPIEPKLWKSFKPDPTMGQLAKLFNGWYLGNEKPLNGVIQLFNCFYLKGQDLDMAIEKYSSGDGMEFNENHLFKERPVYFGWGNTGKSGKIRTIALRIFEQYDIVKTPIYNLDFQDNCFYHPAYLNRSYKRNPKSIEIISRFSKLFI